MIKFNNKLSNSLFIFSASFATFIPFIPFAIAVSQTNPQAKALESKSQSQATKSSILKSELDGLDLRAAQKEVPLSVSDRSDEAVLSWAQAKVRSAFSYNWVDYNEITAQSKIYFTDQGYQHYLKSLKDSGNTDLVVNKKLILQARPMGMAKMLKQAPFQDKYAWQVEVPVVFTYYGINEVETRHAKVVLLISRIARVDSEEGVSIAQLVLKATKE